MTCNKLALTLSPTSKVNLLDECGVQTKAKICKYLKSCSLCHLVGDNCDIRIKPRHQASDHKIQDCHYFAILLIFARMAGELQHLSSVPPVFDPENIKIQEFVLSGEERVRILQSYKIMLGRMMARNIPAFKWLDSILPKHIPHAHSDTAARKSTVVPLKMILKNEAKYEDCVQILDETTKIMDGFFQSAQGMTNKMI